MAEGTEPVAGATSTRSGILAVAAASALAALATWVLQAASGRVLGPARYAEFMVVWGLVLFEVGVLLGLQQEITRRVAQDAGSPPGHRPDDRAEGPSTSIVAVGAWCGSVLAVVMAASSWWWGHHLLGGSWPWLVAANCFVLTSYAVYNAVNGVLSGRREWTSLGAAIAGEGVLRLVLVSVALALAPRLPALSWALALAGATWALLTWRRPLRQALATRVIGTMRSVVAGSGLAMVATGFNAALIAGYPVLVKATTAGSLPADAGPVLGALALTRAPLLLPLTAFAAMILRRFVVAGSHVSRDLIRLSGAAAVLTALAMGLGYLLGPWVLRAVFGPAFVISGGLVAVLFLAAGLLAVQTLSGMALLARGQHSWYVAGWLIATVVALGLLALPVGFSERVALSLVLSPALGIGVSATALRRPARGAGSAGSAQPHETMRPA